MSVAETLGTLGVFLAIVFTAIGLVYNSLNGRLCTVEAQVAGQGVQVGRIDERLSNIEQVVQEIRIDVRAIRNGK